MATPHLVNSLNIPVKGNHSLFTTLRNKQTNNNLYASPNIIRVIKLRRMRRAEHVARMGDNI
jgi:hypothetical protein